MTQAERLRVAPHQEQVVSTRSLVSRYTAIRRFSEALCADLGDEDLVAQSMPDASPLKWHLAHTTWFFEKVVLEHIDPDYEPVDPAYAYLFNSYYNALGDRHARPLRGVLTRPTVPQVREYRDSVDASVLRLLDRFQDAERVELVGLLEIGLNHEQQHQELMLADVKHLFSLNAMLPRYRDPLPEETAAPRALGWVEVQEGVYSIGSDSGSFAFDNEKPRHRVFIEPFALADRLVTNAEYLEFVEDGGYLKPELWLEVGWSTVQQPGWESPVYWHRRDGGWVEFTLGGERELVPCEPVSHVSYLEADAFARWAGARLPTEAEWEVAAAPLPVEGNFVSSGRFHPSAAPRPGGSGLRQMFGDLWEWTSSAYSPYPGFRPEPGILTEYNGKFMCNQLVLRGGSCVTSRDHVRPSYRNFFYPPDRWQFSGIRLAKDHP